VCITQLCRKNEKSKQKWYQDLQGNRNQVSELSKSDYFKAMKYFLTESLKFLATITSILSNSFPKGFLSRKEVNMGKREFILEIQQQCKSLLIYFIGREVILERGFLTKHLLQRKLLSSTFIQLESSKH